MKQCAVLYVNPGSTKASYRRILQDMGFSVHEVQDWPDGDGELKKFEVVLVRVASAAAAPMIAARLRAKPRFGRRVLIGIVPDAVSEVDRRCAQVSGFDALLGDGVDGRLVVARILRELRARPEYRCTIPPRRAA